MATLEGKTAVILGASGEANFGAAVARRLAAEGANVVVSARRMEALQQLAEEIDEGDDTVDSLRWNRAQLKRWIKNAPSQKDMDPEAGLGMPAFPGLSDEDIDNIIAYLATLD